MMGYETYDEDISKKFHFFDFLDYQGSDAKILQNGVRV